MNRPLDPAAIMAEVPDMLTRLADTVESDRLRAAEQRVIERLLRVMCPVKVAAEDSAHRPAMARLYDQAVAPLLAEERRAGAEKGWDDGRAALLTEMGGTWHYYSTDHPTPNPYRADRIAQGKP